MVNLTSDETDADPNDGLCDTDDTVGGLQCTLRAAIDQANTTPALDMITFDLGPGVPKIETLGMEVAHPVVIDGATGGATKVELQGLSGSGSGLYVSGGSSTIKNMILHSFGESGIVFETGTGNVLESTWIGLDVTGTQKPNGAVDLFIESDDHMIGGDTPDKGNVLASAAVLFSGEVVFRNNFIGTNPAGTAPLGAGGGGLTLFGASSNSVVENLISGNRENGLVLFDGAALNVIENNLIGTDVTGTLPVPNGIDGIQALGAVDNLIIGNVIAASGIGLGAAGCAAFGTCDGIDLRGSSARNVVTGNYIGTNAAGASGLGNAQHGVFMAGAFENTIGGTTAGEGNVIAGNGEDGVHLRAGAGGAGTENKIEGNLIGAAAGPGNGRYGVFMQGTLANIIGGGEGVAPGGACTGACNVIGGNGMGGVALMRQVSGVVIRGNYIGTAADGTTPLRNEGPGVLLVGASENLTELNVIAFNRSDGVRLLDIAEESIQALRNRILSNAIFKNDGLGIDLGGNGVTPNNQNVSTGPNDLQPFPILTSVQFDGVKTTIRGFLQSDPNEAHMIQLFASEEPDPTVYGEGQFFLGEVPKTTDPTGRSDFLFEVVGEATNVTATATDAMGNTSEFSRLAGGLIVNDVGDLPDADPNDGRCDVDLDAEGDQCTLRAAIQVANAKVGERDEIEFQIPDCGSCTIKPRTALPPITDPVVIDGTTQDANLDCFPTFLIVELSGEQAGAVDGLTVEAGGAGSLIKGLAINRFAAGSGIALNSNENTITCNFIGTSLSGTQQHGNRTGITIQGSSNLIGGSSFAESNVISGNRRDGVWIRSGRENKVQGNFIGTDRTGNFSDPDNNPATDNALGNGWDGVFIEEEAVDNDIGGVTTEPGVPPGNTISGNGALAPANDRTVGHGVHLEGNVNRVQGNRIGLAHEGDQALPNFGSGVYLYGGAARNVIGVRAGAGNAIAHNGGSGVRVEATDTKKPESNTIQGNAIFSNQLLGIDLGNLAEAGVTPNDTGDGDEGANELLNFPVLGTLERDGTTGDVSFEVMLDTRIPNNGDAVVEFFANEGCDSSGHGEGAQSLGKRTVSTTGGGRATFSHVLSGLPVCRFITATVTDPDGNTSEFSLCTVSKQECLEIIEVQFWHEPPGVGAPVETRRTTDGNPVEVRTMIRNKAQSPLDAELHIEEETGGHVLLKQPESLTFGAGQVTSVARPWNTVGFAWETGTDGLSLPASARRVWVYLLDRDRTPARIVDENRTDVTVKPRPVVLVHGLWSTHMTWVDFEGFLADVRPDWPRGAVGDGEHPGVMNTGKFPSVALGQGVLSAGLVHTTTTIADNAGQLQQYIQSIRETEEAVQVDLVAHSMGGLISRYYVDRLMPRAPSPAVRHLVMMGTPNLGSPCADAYMWGLSVPRMIGMKGLEALGIDLGAIVYDKLGEDLEPIAATNVYQLTPGYVQGTFNREVTEQHGVPFYILGGTLLPFTCHMPFEGDGVVERSSAFAEGNTIPVLENTQEGSLFHTSMPGSEDEAFPFVRRLIDVHPAEASTSKRNDAGSPGSEPNAIASTAEPQVIIATYVPVLPGEQMTLSLPVDQATVFGVTLGGVDNLTSTLSDPSGEVVSRVEAGTLEAASLFRSQVAQIPLVGTWNLNLSHDHPSDTLFVLMAAWIYGSALRIEAALDAPDAAGRFRITGTLTDGGVPVPEAEVAARITAVQDTTLITELDLFDDGAHDDGQAGDGVYGGQTAGLPPATYYVGVWANTGEQLRGTYQLVEVEGTGTTGANLVLDIAAVSEHAATGVPLAYTLTFTNHGPGTATGVSLAVVLPEQVTFGTATPVQGTCTEENHTVTCNLGTLAAGTGTTVELIVTPTQVGLLAMTASVSADEPDWSLRDNTATALHEVVQGTAAETAGEVPGAFQLYTNYPNPFNPQTTIRFDVPETTPVVLRVFDLMGRQVAVLANGLYMPGRYVVTFEAARLPSGFYFYRIEARDFQAIRQMVLLK